MDEAFPRLQSIDSNSPSISHDTVALASTSHECDRDHAVALEEVVIVVML